MSSQEPSEGFSGELALLVGVKVSRTSSQPVSPCLNPFHPITASGMILVKTAPGSTSRNQVLLANLHSWFRDVKLVDLLVGVVHIGAKPLRCQRRIPGSRYITIIEFVRHFVA